MLKQVQKVCEMNPDSSLAQDVLIRSYLAKQQDGEAIEVAQKERQFNGHDVYAFDYVALTYAAAGQRSKAEALLPQLRAQAEGSQAGGHSLAIAQVYAALGEKDQAFAWLQKDFQMRDGGLTLINVLPVLNSLHSDPRFEDLVHRIGLPQ